MAALFRHCSENFPRWLWWERLSRARRQSDMGLTKDSCHCGCGIGTDEPILVGCAHARFAQLIKFTQQRAPFHLAIRTPREVVETLLQQEDKEGAIRRLDCQPDVLLAYLSIQTSSMRQSL